MNNRNLFFKRTRKRTSLPFCRTNTGISLITVKKMIQIFKLKTTIRVFGFWKFWIKFEISSSGFSIKSPNYSILFNMHHSLRLLLLLSMGTLSSFTMLNAGVSVQTTRASRGGGSGTLSESGSGGSGIVHFYYKVTNSSGSKVGLFRQPNSSLNLFHSSDSRSGIFHPCFSTILVITV